MPSTQYCSSPRGSWCIPAGVDHAADADAVADLVARDVAADLGDAADDLVAGHDRKRLRSQSPFTVWMSEWRMPPAYSTWMRTSLEPTARRSMVVRTRGCPAAGAA